MCQRGVAPRRFEDLLVALPFFGGDMLFDRSLPELKRKKAAEKGDALCQDFMSPSRCRFFAWTHPAHLASLEVWKPGSPCTRALSMCCMLRRTDSVATLQSLAFVVSVDPTIGHFENGCSLPLTHSNIKYK